MESEMLTQLALDLKERTMSNGMLTKFVLINIAAQFYAANRSPKGDLSLEDVVFLPTQHLLNIFALKPTSLVRIHTSFV